MEGFTAPYREITPTAMREVYIEFPSVQWTGVGGLVLKKDQIVDQIEFSFQVVSGPRVSLLRL